MHNIKLVVLDMAGTTVDENNVVYKTVHRALLDHGLDLTLETVLKVGAGKEKLQAIKDVLTFLKLDQQVDANLVFETFKSSLDKAYQELEVRPIAGTENTLRELKERNIKVVLNTGYNREIASLLLDKINWVQGNQYDHLITADDVTNGRPHPEMIQRAMELCDVSEASQVLKAGDSAIDIDEGKNARCGVTIGVLSGAQGREQLEAAKPTYVLDSIASIPSLLV